MRDNKRKPQYSRVHTSHLHQKVGYATPLNKLLDNEGLDGDCQIKELVINGDDYIGQSTKKEDETKPKSVDIIFVLDNNTTQLTECKLKIKPKLSSLKQQELDDKVKDTKTLLSSDVSGINYSTDPTPVLFADEVIQRAKFRLRRWYPGRDAEDCPFIALQTSEFIERYFDERS